MNNRPTVLYWDVCESYFVVAVAYASGFLQINP